MARADVARPGLADSSLYQIYRVLDRCDSYLFPQSGATFLM